MCSCAPTASRNARLCMCSCPKHGADRDGACSCHMQIQRCFTILKTRHTAPGSWRSGKQLFETVRALPNLLSDQRSKLDVWIKEAQGMLGDEDIPSSSAPASTQPGGAPAEPAPADAPAGAQDLAALLSLMRQVRAWPATLTRSQERVAQLVWCYPWLASVHGPKLVHGRVSKPCTATPALD
jgi:hypothetical protein